MTGARFNQLFAGAAATDEAERREFEKLLAGRRRSAAAQLAVLTKRTRYTTWPTRRRDHKRRP